jgi:hypothetical protein
LFTFGIEELIYVRERIKEMNEGLKVGEPVVFDPILDRIEKS